MLVASGLFYSCLINIDYRTLLIILSHIIFMHHCHSVGLYFFTNLFTHARAAASFSMSEAS